MNFQSDGIANKIKKPHKINGADIPKGVRRLPTAGPHKKPSPFAATILEIAVPLSRLSKVSATRAIAAGCMPEERITPIILIDKRE